MTRIAISILTALFLTTLLAAQVTITSASRTGDNGSVDVSAQIQAAGTNVTLTRIEFLDKKGKVVATYAMSSEWSSNTRASWTYTDVPAAAVKVRIIHSNGRSNTADITRP
ncbi:MAG: hypothetical protein KDC98_04280 [Planctomycetes bacterium]|nr:hypothetical protein [Planctomycetota bacterium]